MAVVLTSPKRIYLTDFKPFFWSSRVILDSEHLLQNVCKFSQYNAMCEFYVFISLLKSFTDIKACVVKKKKQSRDRPLSLIVTVSH